MKSESAAEREPQPAGGGRPAPAPVSLRCPCGRALALLHSPLQCVCGRQPGDYRDGMWRLGTPVDYWGEIPRSRLEDMLNIARRAGWRRAVAKLAPELAGYLADPRRAAFADLLPVPPASRVLEVGAGLGAIAAALASEYDVTALEGIEPRAEFLALRAAQDRLSHLRVVCADWHRLQFAPGQFDAIVLNGALEWVPIGDRTGSPRQAQVRFLHRVREWLAPRGTIYLGIENRFGWPELRGAIDHSGLPYTSLLPRWLARLVCRWWSPYRSSMNRGYRTHTYSFGGYRHLLGAAGLGLIQTYVCPHGYNLPVDLIPLHAAALRFQKANRRRGDWNWRAHLRRRLVWPWLYRALGGDFALFAADANPRAPAALPNGDPRRA